MQLDQIDDLLRRGEVWEHRSIPIFHQMRSHPEHCELTAQGKLMVSKRIIRNAHIAVVNRAFNYSGQVVSDEMAIEISESVGAPKDSEQLIRLSLVASRHPLVFSDTERLRYLDPDIEVVDLIRNNVSRGGILSIDPSMAVDRINKASLVKTADTKRIVNQMQFTKNMIELYQNSTACVKPNMEQLGFYHDFVGQGVLEGMLWNGRRALVWTDQEGNRYLDRIYPPDNSAYNTSIRNAVVKDLGFKGTRVNESAGDLCFAKARGEKSEVVKVNVTLNESTAKKSVFPYIDSLPYFVQTDDNEVFRKNLETLAGQSVMARNVLDRVGSVSGYLTNTIDDIDYEAVAPGEMKKVGYLFICHADKRCSVKQKKFARCFLSTNIIQNHHIDREEAEIVNGKWAFVDLAKKAGYRKLIRNGRRFWALPEEVIEYKGAPYLKEEMVKVTLGPSKGRSVPKDLSQEVAIGALRFIMSQEDAQELASKEGISVTEAIVKIATK